MAYFYNFTGFSLSYFPNFRLTKPRCLFQMKCFAIILISRIKVNGKSALWHLMHQIGEKARCSERKLYISKEVRRFKHKMHKFSLSSGANNQKSVCYVWPRQLVWKNHHRVRSFLAYVIHFFVIILLFRRGSNFN